MVFLFPRDGSFPHFQFGSQTNLCYKNVFQLFILGYVMLGKDHKSSLRITQCE